MELFVRRPVISIVLALVLLLAGALATRTISVTQFPGLESASLVITTEYTGASADVVQGFITAPIERVARTVPGVDYVDSTTTAGSSKVTAWLKLNEDSNAALAELSSRLSQIDYELPNDAQSPSVSITRTDRAFGIFYLDVDSPQLSRSELTDYLSRRVIPQLASLSGVQRVDIEGGRKPAMRVWLDPIRLASMQLGADEVLNALRRNNIVAATGKTESRGQQVNLLNSATLQSEAEFRALVIASRNNSLVRLGDVATVELGEEAGSINARVDQRDTIYLSVWPLPGANEIAIGDALYQKLDQINASMAGGTHINISFDATQYMRDSIQEIITTLLETVVLVGIVVVALMGSFRTALVPLVTIPISILGCIAAMQMLGFTLNLLTILAVVLSVGLVVDDAIVVVENVARHLREGRSRLEAALVSSHELLSPVVAMTLTLAVVYAPIGFISGLTGALFREFAFTLAIAVLISGLVAVTLSPIMSAWVCADQGREGRMTRWVNRQFERLAVVYARVLIGTFRWQAPLLFAAVLMGGLLVPLYLFSDKELAPVEDQSMVFTIVESAPDASLTYTSDYMRDVVAGLQQLPGANTLWQVINPNNGMAGVNLSPPDQRGASIEEMRLQVFGQLAGVTGLRVLPVLPSALPMAGQYDVELVVQGPGSYAEMEGYAFALVEAAYQSGLFLFADTDLKIDLPQRRLRYNRERIAELGLDVETVSGQLAVLLSEQESNRFDADGRAYRVIPMLQADARQSPDALLDLTIRTPTGALIPLRSLVSSEAITGPRSLGRFEQQRSFRILGGVLPGVTGDQALRVLEQKAADILPPQYSVNWAGMSRQLRQEGSSLLTVIAISLVVVYLVLAVQFNSFRAPLVVLLGSVPLALSGALLFSFFGFTTINIYAQIGFITLVGLIAKNGILITEFANELQLSGRSKLEAVIEAGQVRLRPILMTTAATVLGHFPLVLVTGAGAEARNSIGIILVAGMLIGTLFTLFVLPSVYLLLGDRLSDTGQGADDVTEVEPAPALL